MTCLPSTTIDEFGYSDDFLSSLVDEYGVKDRGLSVAPGEGIFSIVGPNPPGFIEVRDTPQEEDPFFLDAAG